MWRRSQRRAECRSNTPVQSMACASAIRVLVRRCDGEHGHNRRTSQWRPSHTTLYAACQRCHADAVNNASFSKHTNIRSSRSMNCARIHDVLPGGPATPTMIASVALTRMPNSIQPMLNLDRSNSNLIIFATILFVQYAHRRRHDAPFARLDAFFVLVHFLLLLFGRRVVVGGRRRRRSIVGFVRLLFCCDRS
jgi:hypothetical protein